MGCCVDGDYLWCDDVDILVTHEGKKYCIFHAPAECQEKQDQWKNRLVYERIEVAQADQTGCDLAGTIFPQQISFRGFQEDELPYIDFSCSTFTKKALFRNATFGSSADFSRVVFHGTAHFRGTTFKGSANFNDAKFEGDAIFQETTFNAGGCFYRAIFASFSLFSESSFAKSAYFSDAFFGEDTSFLLVSFGSVADFSGAKFRSNANFCSTHFLDSSIFNLTVFSFAHFDYARFEKVAYFRKTVFSGGSFQDCHVGELLEFDRANLCGLSLLGAPIESFRFISCKWPRTNTRNVAFDARRAEGLGYFDIHNMDTVGSFECPEDVPTPIHLGDLFRRLKKIAKDDNDEMMTSDWHYNEKEMQRLGFAEPDATLKWSGKARNFFLLQVLSAYKKFSGYGEAPLRALRWLLIFAMLPLIAEISPSPLIFPGKMLYYLPLVKARPESLADFSTCAHLGMITWQLVITIQAALFVFALRNKFRR